MYDAKIQASPEPKVTGQERPDRILLVDDDTASVEPLHIQLRLQGFEVVLAGTGRQALDVARSWHPDAIVLDLCLPDVSGLEVCQELAADTATTDIPVIILSGMEGKDIVRRCRAVGGMYYIAKPYDPNVLLLLISEAVAEHKLWHQTAVEDDE
ncbi:MAG: response regulator [Thermogutta sp.]